MHGCPVSPFAARLVKHLLNGIEETRDALERGHESPASYHRLCGEIAAARGMIEYIREEDRAYQTDDEDDEQPADAEAA